MVKDDRLPTEFVAKVEHNAWRLIQDKLLNGSVNVEMPRLQQRLDELSRAPNGPGAQLAPTWPQLLKQVVNALAAELGLHDVVDGQLGFESQWLVKAITHVATILHSVFVTGGELQFSMCQMVTDEILKNSRAVMAGTGSEGRGRGGAAGGASGLTLERTSLADDSRANAMVGSSPNSP